MARAIQLAKKGRCTTDPNPRVGCVLVRDNAIIGEGWHVKAGLGHAEVEALKNVRDAQGATAYVTLEPCSHHGKTPPCCDALIKAGISRVVAAMQDPNPLVAGRGLDGARREQRQRDIDRIDREGLQDLPFLVVVVGLAAACCGEGEGDRARGDEDQGTTSEHGHASRG